MRCPSFHVWAFLLVALASSTLFVQAENLLKNPDFTDGKKKWKTEGSVTHTELKEGGELTPVLEMSLSTRRPTEFYQKFDLEPSKTLYVEVIAKASEDLDVAPQPGVDKFSPRGSYLFNPPQRPPNDILIEISDVSMWYYRAGELPPGGDWVKVSFTFDKLSDTDARGRDLDERTFRIIAPVGNGKIWVKSVTAELR